MNLGTLIPDFTPQVSWSSLGERRHALTAVEVGRAPAELTEEREKHVFNAKQIIRSNWGSVK